MPDIHVSIFFPSDRAALISDAMRLSKMGVTNVWITPMNSEQMLMAKSVVFGVFGVSRNKGILALPNVDPTEVFIISYSNDIMGFWTDRCEPRSRPWGSHKHTWYTGHADTDSEYIGKRIKTFGSPVDTATSLDDMARAAEAGDHCGKIFCGAVRPEWVARYGSAFDTIVVSTATHDDRLTLPDTGLVREIIQASKETAQ